MGTIISASRRTDIPAFYSQWFSNRLKKGHCKVYNPISGESRRISLHPEDVDAFVFWTKNILPFLQTLQELKKPFVVQHTINNYPRVFEPNVGSLPATLRWARYLGETYTSESLVWRYDTIILSSITDGEWHRKNFKGLCRALQGFTEEVTVSFLQDYPKASERLSLLSREHSFELWKPGLSEITELLSDLATISSGHGIQLSICSQPEYLIEGVKKAVCIDSERLQKISGVEIKAKKKGTRKACGCHQSTDIGLYNSCLHGCAYCYAVKDPKKAMKSYLKHDPNAESL